MSKATKFRKLLKSYQSTNPILVEALEKGFKAVFEYADNDDRYINQLTKWSIKNIPEFEQVLNNTKQLFSLKSQVTSQLSRIKESFPQFLYFDFENNNGFVNLGKDVHQYFTEKNPNLDEEQIDDLTLGYSHFDFDDWLRITMGDVVNNFLNTEVHFESGNVDQNMDNAVRDWTSQYFNRGYSKFWGCVKSSLNSLIYGTPGWKIDDVKEGLERIYDRFPDHVYFDTQAGNVIRLTETLEEYLRTKHRRESHTDKEIESIIREEKAQYYEIDFDKWKKIMLGDLAQYT